ncbi:MAG: phosphoribosylformylglycinamidine cyclo-ligase [Spirochaetales bacterium]|jgi:phosphoribosylformylglycinamidine cyclo-ligase|nr:phosphoribosylformylglycinamidine cyclo-ligase [Exilispira sp.]NMC67272.1 phosphoribosylformylglycinamidine cyclo-ligase [Spirochaetales bacterium]
MDYKEAGVDIEEGYKAVSLIKKHAAKTFDSKVLNGIGSFAALFDISKLKEEGIENPVLVSGADGVGTKIDIAMKLKIYDTIGIDCVAMCVNDILCHGAKPLFFLDYLACGKLNAQIAGLLVKGVSDGCLEAGCSLVGGETAEMPGFYPEGEYDLAGFAVGVVDKNKIIDGSKIEKDDIIIGIESSGLHSNGFSLIRKIIRHFDAEFEGKPIGEILLTPTSIYVKPILALSNVVQIKAMAHITGGGFIENIPRIFSKDFTAVIKKNSYPIPRIFQYIKSFGIDENKMYNTFNMGIGFVLVVSKEDSKKTINFLDSLGFKSYEIGFIKEEKGGICLE